MGTRRTAIDRRRLLSGGVVSIIGWLLLAIPLYDMWDDLTDLHWGAVSTLAENAVFVALALGLIGGGVWLVRSDWPTAYVTMVSTWTTVGTFAIALLLCWVVWIQWRTMGELKPFVLAMDGLFIGSVVIFALSVQRARTRRRDVELEHHQRTARLLTALHGVASDLQEAGTRQDAYDTTLDALERWFEPVQARIVHDGTVVAERTVAGGDGAEGPDEATRRTAAVGKWGRVELVGASAADVESGILEILATHLDRTLVRLDRERRLAEQRDQHQFLSRTLRHNLLNHLQAIQARTQILREDDAEEPDAHLRVIRRNVERMAWFIDMVREYTRLVERGETEPEPVPLRDTIREEVDSVRDVYDAAAVRLGSVPDVDVAADDMLHSVFENLLTNAIEHNDERVPTVRIDGERRGDEVVVRFADNGPGIPDERKAEVFERGTEDESSAGSGFGLYFVAEVVDTYGGSVAVRDNDPEGAVFELTLPVA